MSNLHFHANTQVKSYQIPLAAEEKKKFFFFNCVHGRLLLVIKMSKQNCQSYINPTCYSLNFISINIGNLVINLEAWRRNWKM